MTEGADDVCACHRRSVRLVLICSGGSSKMKLASVVVQRTGPTMRSGLLGAEP